MIYHQFKYQYDFIYYIIITYMCFSKGSSKRALLFGILCGLALMQFGKEEYNGINKTLGLFFIFVSLMQYVEYLIWSDLECKNGNNKLAGTIGPLLNYLQPTALFILVIIFFKKAIITNEDMIPLVANVGYLAYILYQYYNYMKKDKLCSRVGSRHLEWSWRNYRDYQLYNTIMIFNILFYLQEPNGLIFLGITYLYLFLSMFKFNQHIGEFWCYLTTNVPLVLLILQKTIL